MGSPSLPPKVYAYADYRKFMRDHYLHMKTVRPGFSYRFLAKRAGFASPNYFKLVMDGKRNLSTEAIPRCARALKLTRHETDFFTQLVHFNQTRSSEQRQHFAQQLVTSGRFRSLHPLSEAQFNYYAQWYFIPIRELVGSPAFSEDPQTLARSLNPPITADQARRALRELLTLGLIERGPNGKLRRSTGAIVTGDEVVSSAIAQYHRHMIRLAGEAIERIPRQEREISAITTGLSRETCAQVKEMIRVFRDQVLDAIAHDSGETEKVVQINFQLFPISEAA
ncbi:MAG: TIGR02147 family protein [Bacteriovoracia bacterium]